MNFEDLEKIENELMEVCVTFENELMEVCVTYEDDCSKCPKHTECDLYCKFIKIFGEF